MSKNMKVMLLIAMSVMLSFAAGCSCKHEWEEATCKEPKTCTLCGETEGEVIAHAWAEATCKAPKTCTLCGETEGEVIAHEWTEAACDTPKTCALCDETEGDPLGHLWSEIVIEGAEAVSTCEKCGLEDRHEASAEEILMSPDGPLVGKWVSMFVDDHNEMVPFDGYSYIEVFSDGTALFQTMEEFSVTWKLNDHNETMYAIELTSENGDSDIIFLAEGAEFGYTIIYQMAEDVYCYFFKE